MKRQFLPFCVLILCMWACNKSASEQEAPPIPEKTAQLAGLPRDPFYGIPDSMSILDISVGIIVYDAYKTPYFQSEEATIVVWPSAGRHLDITNAERAMAGYAYDAVRDTSIYSDNIATIDRIAQQDLPPGRYFIAVVLNNKVDAGKRAYSTTEVELTQFGKIAIHKAFDEHSKDEKFEVWSK